LVKEADLQKHVPFSHLKYSDEEEATLVRSIADKNAYERMSQSAFWKALEEEEVLENRTARGMHSHFEREILPNLKTGKKSYGLAEKELGLFKKWQSDKERKQEKRRQMTDMEKKQQREKDVIEEEELRTEQEKKDREEEKEGDGKSQGNLQLGYQESPYFRENPTAIAVGSEEGSMELFQHYLEGLEGYKVRSTDVNTEKGTIRQAHFLSPDGYILKTRQGVLEYLAVEGKTSMKDIVTIGRSVLKVSDRRIKSFLNNWTEAIEATTFGGFSSSDEDEAAKEEAEKEDDTNLGLTCYTFIYIYIVPFKYFYFNYLFIDYDPLGGGDVVGTEMVEGKRGAAVNVVVHVDDGDKGDDRQEVIGSDNTGGGGAKTDGIAAREQKEAMDSAARVAAKTGHLKSLSADIEEVNMKDNRENDGNKHPDFDETKKLANTFKRKPQVGNVALEKRTVVIDQTLTSGFVVVYYTDGIM